MSKKSRLKQLALPKESRKVNSTYGSQLWSYNHFRINILSSLLNDLIDLENEGLEEDICKVVRKSLEYYINASTNIPEGGFLSGGPLYLEIESFADTYRQWNDVKGKEPEVIKQRVKIIRILRKKRQKITNKIRRLQFEIENNLDQKILADSYNAIGEIINLVPNIFRNLGSSYKDYLKAAAV